MKAQGRRKKKERKHQSSSEWQTEATEPDKVDSDDEYADEYEVLHFASGHTLTKRAATFMQAFWKEIGIEDCSLPPLIGEEEDEDENEGEGEEE